MMGKVHARLMPSAAAATVQCHGSVVMREQFPDEGDTEAAREGEAAHWVVEEMIEGVIVPVGTAAPNGVVVTPEMIKGGNMVVADMQEQLGPNWRQMVAVEQTLPADPALHPECFGTPDAFAVRVDRTTLFVWDYKFGFGPVNAAGNWQLIAYFALLLHFLNLANDQAWTVRFAVVQPRDYLSGERGVKAWTVNAAQLRAEVNILGNAFRQALGPNPRLRVGPECRYCSARGRCPELLRAGLAEAEWGMRAQPHDLQPQGLGLELAMLDRALEILKALRTGLEAEAEAMIMGGAQVPGYALGRGDGRVVWTKKANEVINTGKLLGYNLAKPPEAITPKQALDLGMPAEVVNQWSESKPGALKLVPESASEAAKAFG